jgi:methionyl-tRNA synthetase
MIHQYRSGVVPSRGGAACRELAQEAIRAARASYHAFEFSKALDAVWGLLSAADKFIVERAPWTLAKKGEEAAAQLDDTLYTAAEVLRLATVLVSPVLPESCSRIWSQLGMTQPLESTRLDTLDWGQLPAGQLVGKVEAVFPRVDAKPAIEKMKALEVTELARQSALMGKPQPPPASAPPLSPRISIDDFAKVDLRVGEVVSAEPVKGADRLLHMKVDIGEPEPRTIVAGIALAYKPEQILGRKVVIVANLEPRKLRGIESNGMIVAASLEGGDPVLAGFLEHVPVGARLK